ncbi:excisionase family DNA-binding protein [Mycolicibacterium sp. BiH015]|uniref:helix-turn-helix transcriptional regulator n=1 Tax=Mycolicibacterium sp. BiH015 TaxID=3018808 RepID=UPI0022E17AD3|nr:excisionase family DNA-binding protein [Mycolicibacterium sp. BiH015]MDA2891267.1 excisionase family DNA-binding protein [Mycolicibacterium sp. BiH015]
MPAPSRSAAQHRRWASIPEVAGHIGTSQRTVRRMIADGRLRAYQCGPRILRLDLNEIDAAMKPFGGAA